MNKLVLVRGHSGSGKTTFATQKIAAEGGVHFENDMFLYTEQGEYKWSLARLKEAQELCKNLTEAAMVNQERQVIVSNVFSTPNSMKPYYDLAKKHGYQVEVYCCTNVQRNNHDVPLWQVVKQYLAVRSNRVGGEVTLPCVVNQGDVEFVHGFLDLVIKAQDEDWQPLYDHMAKTYLTPETIDVLRIKDLVQEQPSVRYPGLSVLKYRRDTFYNASWSPELLELRGVVVDQNNRLVVRPFNKMFNYSEYKTGRAYGCILAQPRDEVQVVEKVNGFLGVATYDPLLRGVLYSTTGSLDSPFADLARKHLEPYEALFKLLPGHSFMFEVCDESDPHIIKERLGAYLIGCRSVRNGYFMPEVWLDKKAATYDIKRPNHYTCTLREVLDKVKRVKHEGFMVYTGDDGNFKIKSPYYLATKLFARSKAEALQGKLTYANVEEEYYPLVDHIKANFDSFKALTEQGRIAFIEEFLGVHNG